MIDPRGMALIPWADAVILSVGDAWSFGRLTDEAKWQDWAAGFVRAQPFAQRRPPASGANPIKLLPFQYKSQKILIDQNSVAATTYRDARGQVILPSLDLTGRPDKMELRPKRFYEACPIKMHGP